MKTGDIVRDGQGRAFQIGQLLGRTLWSKTYSAREDGGSAEWALSVALSKADLPSGMGHLEPICREILLEEARLRGTSRLPCLAPVESRFATAAGAPVLLAPRYTDTLERRLTSGAPLEEVLRLCIKVSDALVELQEALPCHGNLRPHNTFIDERGQILLSAPLTPIARKHVGELLQAAGASTDPYLPPEQRGGRGPAPTPILDSYALCMMLYWSALASTEGAVRPLEAPLSGLDKSQLVALKDRIHSRLKEERANPRFHTRLSDQASALLNRALSEQISPSPPYRFALLTELRERLQKLHALVNPTVTHVGKILLDRPPGSEAYSTDEEVQFSCTIGCSPGVGSHEEIACGLALFDQDTNERLRDTTSSYTVDNHPSGRLRFGFRLTDLAPGSYLVRVAFTIRESGSEPSSAEGRFEVRAAPGYIPPRPAPRPARPLSLERDSEPITQTTPPPADAPSLQDAVIAAQAARSRLFADEDAQDSAEDEPRAPQIRLGGMDSTPAAAAVAGVSVGAGAEVVDLSQRGRPPQLRLPPMPPPQPERSPRPYDVPDEEKERPTSPSVRLSGEPATSPGTGGSAPRRRPIHRADTTQGAYDPEPESGARDPYAYDEPRRTGRGTWESELPPPPQYGADDLYGEGEEEELPDEPTDIHPPGPIGDALGRLIELVRGDAYTMILGGAAVVILLLIGVLFILQYGG